MIWPFVAGALAWFAWNMIWPAVAKWVTDRILDMGDTPLWFGVFFAFILAAIAIWVAGFLGMPLAAYTLAGGKL